MSIARAGRASGRWLAPALLSLGVAIAGLGVWYTLHSRPTPGDYYEVFALDATTAVALRHERGSERSFIELVELGRGVHWQALIPPYAGRPGAPAIAASPTAVTVRVHRDGKDELWALSTNDAEKLGQVQLLPGAEHAGATPPAVVTVGDRKQSFELVGDATHATAVTAIELASGRAQWHVELGSSAITAGWLDDATVWFRAGGAVIGLDRATGQPAHAPVPAAEPPAADYHRADGAAWTLAGDHLEVHDAASGALRGTVGD